MYANQLLFHSEGEVSFGWHEKSDWFDIEDATGMSVSIHGFDIRQIRQAMEKFLEETEAADEQKVV